MKALLTLVPVQPKPGEVDEEAVGLTDRLWELERQPAEPVPAPVSMQQYTTRSSDGSSISHRQQGRRDLGDLGDYYSVEGWSRAIASGKNERYVPPKHATCPTRQRRNIPESESLDTPIRGSDRT